MDKENLEEELKRVKEERDKYKSLYEITAKELKECKESNKINSRGAGRKEKLTEQKKEMVRMYRYQGKTIKYIADFFECSEGLICKVLKE